MSVDLKRLQQLAEAVGWKIEEQLNGYTLWYSNEQGDCEWYNTLSPIRTRLEAEYRKLAEQAQRTLDISRKLQGGEPWDSQQATHLTRIADELSVVEEPTMVEKLREGRNKWDGHPFVLDIFDALIELYERKEK